MNTSIETILKKISTSSFDKRILKYICQMHKGDITRFLEIIGTSPKLSTSFSNVNLGEGSGGGREAGIWDGRNTSVNKQSHAKIAQTIMQMLLNGISIVDE